MRSSDTVANMSAMPAWPCHNRKRLGRQLAPLLGEMTVEVARERLTRRF